MASPRQSSDLRRSQPPTASTSPRPRYSVASPRPLPRPSSDTSGPITAPQSPQSPRSPVSNTASPTQSRHQRFVLSDPVAFGYLAEDPTTVVLDKSRRLEGYQIYVVEQWACSRTHPTFVITAYTGDPSHSIQAGVLSVPADEASWSPRLRVYFKTLAQYYARKRDTPIGSLMVTNLSTFPSSLTIVLVPDGNLRKHREDFFVSENLKRLGCSGRVGLSIAPPTLPTQAKFHQLYRVSDKIDFYSAVIELVKLCQTALLLFGCLEPEYADGLLCDVTEKAVNEWWYRIGTDMYGVEPTDGILGHTTVAALLGTLIGARNRLSAYGAPIAKDVFDLDTTKKAISHFQKAQRMTRSRRLDRQTLDHLQKATAKQASGDGWKVPSAFKSTVAELSGKGGEMVMDLVGKTDKASIADVETADIDRFAQLVRGERARWLWHGKARKRTTRDIFSEKPIKKPGIRRNGDADGDNDREEEDDAAANDLPPERQRQPTELPHREESGQRPSIDSRDFPPLEEPSTAFGRAKERFKGAVGAHGHQRGKSSRNIAAVMARNGRSAESISTIDDPSSQASPRMSEDIEENKLEHTPSFAKQITETPVESRQDLQSTAFDQQPELRAPFEYDSETPLTKTNTAEGTANDSFVHELEQELPEQDRRPYVGHLLRRSQSADTNLLRDIRPELFPRQLSFGIAEPAITSSNGVESVDLNLSRQSTASNPKAALEVELLRAEEARHFRSQIADLDANTARWVLASVAQVEDLDALCAQDLEQLNSIYYPRQDEHQSLTEGSREIVAEERTKLQEAVRDVETLGAKLEYEIGTLRDKVEDVEDAVREFEKRVVYTEGRVGDLVGLQTERVGWGQWLGVMLFGDKSTKDEGLKA